MLQRSGEIAMTVLDYMFGIVDVCFCFWLTLDGSLKTDLIYVQYRLQAHQDAIYQRDYYSLY